MVVPATAYGGQRLMGYSLDTFGAKPAASVEERDGFGNRVVRMHFPKVPARLQFTLDLDLQRTAGGPPPTLPVADAADYLRPSDLTDPGSALVRAARGLGRVLSGDPHARAAQINRWVFRTMRYEKGVSGVRTTAAEAIAQRAGVCQDFAHVMIAVCRLNGIAARYVSGHLLGEGGTHAWVEVLLPAPDCPDKVIARAFDPTHGRIAGMTYITVATGRDYRDVAPTTGTYSAPYGGRLTARKIAVVTSVEYADADAEETEAPTPGPSPALRGRGALGNGFFQRVPSASQYR
jgi:transglutaminase-like putative cysteine protease